MARHCNNDEENPYIDNSIAAWVGRRTGFGSGIPKGTYTCSIGEIMYGEVRKMEVLNM